MIARVLGEGQFELDDDLIGELNQLDERLLDLVEMEDEENLHRVLAAMVQLIRDDGRELEPDELVTSDVVFPPADANLAEVRELISGEGLVPD